MYACLYAPIIPKVGELVALASQFSPEIEQTTPQAVVFSLTGLTRLFGSPLQLVAALQQAAAKAQLALQLAVASSPDSALLLAHHSPETIAITPKEERAQLARLPLTALWAHAPSLTEKVAAVLPSWGVETCGELAALPERDVAERLGSTGVHLQRLARGQVQRPLRLLPIPARYEEQVAFDHPAEQRDSLLFSISRVLQALCDRLQTQSDAARAIHLEFAVEEQSHRCEVEFAVPLAESAAILKLVQLHLERHGPPSAVLAFTLRLLPTAARRVQQTLFDPPSPPADTLQVTLARVAAGLGTAAVGCPQLIDTHRPDTFSVNRLPLAADSADRKPSRSSAKLQLALRRFRPPWPARVQTLAGLPHFVRAASLAGPVRRCSGAWKTAGEWWAATAWSHEEWDVELEGGALYRLCRERTTGQWYVEGVYD